ncbi:DUF5906 domain-containing protein [Variovorax dokdonensis]|uniref:DUF5906 domain-containing protein n=1 Tax=Variovorax dokdonensis TaxID=344883 RepID=A0ABT7NG91_9BURK|nr:primase-helicase family protein [Variovorax dokdonensis]MDM0046941.1 DUF5906 domain-containing protein [Variovorax dokdonensis]
MLDFDISPEVIHSSAGVAESSSELPASAGAVQSKRPIDWGQLNLLLDRFTLIYGTDNVWDQAEHMMMKVGAMSLAHGNDLVNRWKTNDERRTVRPDQVVFDPSQTCGDECVNLFAGMDLAPKAGDVEPILELIRYLTSRTSDKPEECAAITHWLLCWLAYPLQNMGSKQRTAVIMHGDEGTGKSFLFDLVVDIYGKYGAVVGQDELEDRFNDWRSAKLFVVGDEISSRAELVHNKNRLKALITSPTVQINPKNFARRTEKNHMNIVFLSNENQPLALDNSDRRYLVVHTPGAKDPAYYSALGAWKAAGGTAAFYDYLLRYPVGDFSIYAPPPFTQAKADLIDINRKSPERFWADWYAGQIDLPYHSCEVDQAFQAYIKFAARIGDRFPVQRELFSRMVLRFSDSMGHSMQIKSMQVPQVGGGRKARRMLLVCPIPKDVKEGEWAAETYKVFAEHLRKYIGGNGGTWSRSPGEEAQTGRGNE